MKSTKSQHPKLLKPKISNPGNSLLTFVCERALFGGSEICMSESGHTLNISPNIALRMVLRKLAFHCFEGN